MHYITTGVSIRESTPMGTLLIAKWSASSQSADLFCSAFAKRVLCTHILLAEYITYPIQGMLPIAIVSATC
jgi:hypothetical protein